MCVYIYMYIHIKKKCGVLLSLVENSIVILPYTPTHCHSTYEHSNDFVVEMMMFYLTLVS